MARRAQLGGQRRDPFLAPGRRRDDGAFGREPADGGRADAAGRTGDQDHPAQQALADEGEWRRLLVIAAQRTGQLPAGDPERLSSLLLALTHGAVDLALAGHLTPTGKGHATPAELADDLLGYLRAAAQREAGPGHDGAPAAGPARPG